MSALAGLSPYLVLIPVGFLPNEIWRARHRVSRGLDEDSELVVWVRAVATAILTGVVAKLVVFAPGALRACRSSCGFGALVGVAAFLLSGRSVFAGVLVGTLAVLVGAWASGDRPRGGGLTPRARRA